MAVSKEQNERINDQLRILYQQYENDHIAIWQKHFPNNANVIMNHFGIVDVEHYDTDNGVLFICKETRGYEGWDEKTFLEWLRDAVIYQKNLGTKYPRMWYNLGRWAKLIREPNATIKTLANQKQEALSGLRYIAFTNINKVGGGSTSGKGFKSISKEAGVKELLAKEINEIEPKTVVVCGKGMVNMLADVFEKFEGKFKIIEVPHPAARKSAKEMLIAFKQVWEQNNEKTS